MSRWLQEKTTALLASRSDRRGFMVRSAVVGSALAAKPLQYVLTPGTAYAAICSCANMGCDCGSACCDGWTEFCCVINGANQCPPGTLAGGWWKADGTSFCGGAARYYIDCNVAPGFNPCSCQCGNGSCTNRRSCCTRFRYGQCHQEIASMGAIMCRVVSCTPPWNLDSTCTADIMTDNRTAAHNAACLIAPPKPPPPPPPSPRYPPEGVGVLRGGDWFLRDTATSGPSDVRLNFGLPGDIPVVGDWNGNGGKGVGVFRDGDWYLRDSPTSGPIDYRANFGVAGDIPVVGDWNGDGYDSIGVFRKGNWYLRHSPSSGPIDFTFDFGVAGDIPVVGDWNGDARHGIGVYRKGDWYLRDSPSSGAIDYRLNFGLAADLPIAGHW